MKQVSKQFLPNKNFRRSAFLIWDLLPTSYQFNCSADNFWTASHPSSFHPHQSLNSRTLWPLCNTECFGPFVFEAIFFAPCLEANASRLSSLFADQWLFGRLERSQSYLSLLQLILDSYFASSWSSKNKIQLGTTHTSSVWMEITSFSNLWEATKRPHPTKILHLCRLYF